MGTVLIVDDHEDIRFPLVKVVEKMGHSCFAVETGNDGIELLQSTVVDLVFLDIGLPDHDGLDLIPTIKEVAEDIEIVMLTGINEAKTAVKALQAGAVDYIVKPFDLLEFRTVLTRLLQTRLMRNRASIIDKAVGLDSILGECKLMHKVKEKLVLAAESKSPVLITGETGTGKELAAKAIHYSSNNDKGLFITVDCGTLTKTLLEAELFGYEKGAFTDASKKKQGLIELASGGTLFLDEIGNLPMDLQPKLLRLIEESTFRRVGGLKDIRVNTRIVAATNENLEERVANNLFRQDLFFRINVIPIELPPLARRGDDILLLADFFLEKLQQEMKKKFKGFTRESRKKLLDHPWPGNIRELRNLIEKEVIFTKSGWLNLTGLSPVHSKSSNKSTQLLSLQEVEKAHIKKVLNNVGNNKSKAARILGISRTTLRSKLT